MRDMERRLPPDARYHILLNAVARKQGADWYTSAIYRARADRTFVENALIDLYKPMLNR